MICTATVKHPTWPTGGVCLQNNLVPCFRSLNILRALHVSYKYFRNPNRSVQVNISTSANKLGKHFALVVVLQNKVRTQALSWCLCLWLISISIWGHQNRFLWFLDNLFWLRLLLLGPVMNSGRVCSLPFFGGAALPHFTMARPHLAGRAALCCCCATLYAGWSIQTFPLLKN